MQWLLSTELRLKGHQLNVCQPTTYQESKAKAAPSLDLFLYKIVEPKSGRPGLT